jgi:hypothetical protein
MNVTDVEVSVNGQFHAGEEKPSLLFGISEFSQCGNESGSISRKNCAIVKV